MLNSAPSVRQILSCAVFLAMSCRFKQLHNPADSFLDDSRMDETSGIAASVTNPGYYYVHNDSGDSSRFFAIRPDGHLKAILYFDGNPALPPFGVKDCEDIAVGTGPDSGTSYVYMGDIGDNNAARPYITIYRIKEPQLPPAADSTQLTDSTQLAGSKQPTDSTRPTGTTPILAVHLSADPLFLQYPDGPRDAETLMADAIDQKLYIVSKREDSVHVYSTPLNFKAHDTLTLTKDATLYFSGRGKWITAGDISRTGDQVLLKSYRRVYYWQRRAGEPIWKTLERNPFILPYRVEPQGEAIAFTPDGKSYYTVSEGVKPELYYYKLPKLKK